MKRVFLIFLLILVVAAGALVILPSFIDWGKYRGEIVAQMEQATGHDYEISGAIEFSVLPYPRVLIEGLKVSGPAAPDSPLLTLQRAEASLALAPLFKGEVIVDSVLFVQPHIALTIAPDGAKSWMTPVLAEKMAQKQGGAAPAGGLEAISLNAIRIKDGSFSYRDLQDGTSYEFSSIDLTLKGDTILGPYTATGDLSYAGTDIGFSLNSGRIGSGEDSIALKTTIDIPVSATTISFSGVVALAPSLEIQGDTGIKTQNLSSLAALAGEEKPPAYLARPFSANGILTASAAQLSYNNLNLAFGALKAGGSISAKGLDDTSKPLDLGVKLHATELLDLDALLPEKQARKAGSSGFIPETVTLPRAINGTFAITAPGFKYKSVTLQSFELTASAGDRTIEAGIAGKTGEQGSLNADIKAVFASSSRTEATGAVTLSDPVLSYKLALEATDGAQILKGFIPAGASDTALAALSGPVSFNLGGAVKPSSVAVDSGAATLQGTSFAYSGVYKAATGKADALLKANISTQRINADKWQTLLSGGKADAGKKSTDKTATVKEIVSTLAVPFDVDLGAVAENVRFAGRDYDRFDLAVLLAGKRLTVGTFALKDKDGNFVSLSGNIGDLAALDNIDLSLSGKTPDVKSLLQGLGKETANYPDSLKAAEIIAALKGSAENLEFTANLAAMGGTLDMSGKLAGVLEVPHVSNLTLRLKHPSYVELARLFVPSFDSGVAIKKTLDIFASMKREGAQYSFTNLQAQVGPVTATGTAGLDLSNAKPDFSADLSVTELPLDHILGHEAGHKGTVRARPLRNNPEVRWSRTPIDFSWMKAANADIRARIQKFSYGPWVANNADAAITLKDGTLNVEKLTGSVFGGEASLAATVMAPAEGTAPVSVKSDIAAKGVVLEDFVGAFSGSKLVRARGNVTLETSIETTGQSVSDFILNLGGTGTSTGSGLVFEGFDLAQVSRVLAQPSSSMSENLLAFNNALKGGTTTFDTLDAAYTINKGILDFTTLQLVGPQATVSSTGKINLPLWTLDMVAVVDLIDPPDAPNLTATFKGPLDNPGKTFGKSVIEGYLQKYVGDRVRDAIGDTLEKKLGGSDAGKLLQGVLGGAGVIPQKQQAPVRHPSPSQTIESTPLRPQDDTEGPRAPEPPQQQNPVVPTAPTSPEQPGSAVPEDGKESLPDNPGALFQNLLEGVLEGAGQKGQGARQ